MHYVPDEVLSSIASKLGSVQDLRSFRLVCRRWANISFPIAAYHLATLNTSESLEEFITFLRRFPGASTFTKHLTIYHGQWPICSRPSFEVHPLLFGGKEKWVGLGSPPDTETTTAYNAYNDFITKERNRSPSSDHLQLSLLLQSLPSVTALSITPIQKPAWRPKAQSRYLALVKRIWLFPMYSTYVDRSVFRVLPTLNQFPRLTRLNITGNFQPSAPECTMEHILCLQIEALEVPQQRPESATEFLSAFKKVRNLKVAFRYSEGETTIPLNCLHLPDLRALLAQNTSTSEDSLYQFIQRHQSAVMSFEEAVLFGSGSWEHLGERLDSLEPPIEIMW